MRVNRGIVAFSGPSNKSASPTSSQRATVSAPTFILLLLQPSQDHRAMTDAPPPEQPHPEPQQPPPEPEQPPPEPQFRPIIGQIPAGFRQTTISAINVATRDPNYLEDESAQGAAAQDPQNAQGQEGNPNLLEDTSGHFLVACVIGLKYHPKQDGVFTIRQRGLGSAPKMQKVNYKYRRMWVCGDMGSNGAVFAVFERNNDDMAMFFDGQPQHELKLGDIILLVEPKPVEYILPGTIYKVEVSRHWILLQRPNLPREIPPKHPHQEKQEFFYVRNVSIKAMMVVPVRAVCNGSLCDRQRTKAEMANQGCGCISVNSRTPGFVLQANVKVNLGNLGTQTIKDFRSWRFTNHIFRRTPPSSDSSILNLVDNALADIRACTRNIVDYVNNECGWDIIGWYKRGQQVDGSATASGNPNDVDQLVASDTAQLHISYLAPSDYNLKNTQAFQQRQYNPASHLDL